jgi:single-strand DNA-binding protein
MLNKVMLIGRLGKDPELKTTPGGTPVANLSLATQRSWRDELGEKHSETEWHNVVAWSKLAEIVGQFMRKGALVYVEGRLQTHSWKTYGVTHRRTEVIAEQAWLLEWKEETEETTHEMPTEALPL